MTRLHNLTELTKSVYLLALCDLVVDELSDSQGYEIAVEALEKCEEWVQTKNVEADQLYFYLENIDENDIMSYMQMESEEKKEAAWICVANTLAYIVRTAYDYEEAVYMPETIECVDDKTIESFLMNFNKIYLDESVNNKLLDYLVDNYSLENNGKQLDVLKIKQLVKEYRL